MRTAPITRLRKQDVHNLPLSPFYIFGVIDFILYHHYNHLKLSAVLNTLFLKNGSYQIIFLQ